MNKVTPFLLLFVLFLSGCATVIDRMNGVPKTTLEPMPSEAKKPTVLLNFRFTPGFTINSGSGRRYLSFIEDEVIASGMFIKVDETATPDFKLEFHLDANSSVGRGAASAVASGFTLGLIPSQDKVVTTLTASLSQPSNQTTSTFSNSDGLTESTGLFFIALSSNAEQGSSSKVLDYSIPNQARALLKEIRASDEYQNFINQ